MKTAIVLFADSPFLLREAGDIRDLLSGMEWVDIQVWLFYHQEKPVWIPDIAGSGLSLKLIFIKNPYQPEAFLGLLEAVQKEERVEFLIFSGDGLGEELATRLAFRLNGSSCLKVDQCKKKSGSVEVLKSVYGNHLKARLVLTQPPFCISPDSSSNQPTQAIPIPWPLSGQLTLEQVPVEWVKSISIDEKRPDKEWIHAERILVAGQGARCRENIQTLERIAHNLGAELCASRPVVMNAWMDMGRLIGASGSVISPKICLAAGVSGSGMFNAGIEQAEFIVAVNTDKEASIFKIADIGIVDDMMDVLTELEKLILSDRSGSITDREMP